MLHIKSFLNKFTEVKCSGCKRVLDQEKHFHKDKSRISGYNHRCKDCAKAAAKKYRRSPEAQREYELQYYYGISKKEYDALAEAQDNKCAICGEHPEKHLAVDHCHRSGVIRGLLCRTCNSGIGLLKDDPRIVSNAAYYLRNFYRDKIIRR